MTEPKPNWDVVKHLSRQDAEATFAWAKNNGFDAVLAEDPKYPAHTSALPGKLPPVEALWVVLFRRPAKAQEFGLPELPGCGDVWRSVLKNVVGTASSVWTGDADDVRKSWRVAKMVCSV